jgi:hypothetical protein
MQERLWLRTAAQTAVTDGRTTWFFYRCFNPRDVMISKLLSTGKPW